MSSPPPGGVVSTQLDAPSAPGVTPVDDDPCFNGVTTLIYMLPCSTTSPTMAQWCARADVNHDVVAGIDACADVPRLPVTGTTTTTTLVGGFGSCLLGLALIGAARRRTARP